MTEPTLTELREMARRTVTRRHHESEEGILATAFLSLSDQLAAVTAERDAAMRNCSDAFDALNTIRAERDDLQPRIDAAPVAWAVVGTTSERLLFVDTDQMRADDEAESWDDESDPTEVTRVRLVQE